MNKREAAVVIPIYSDKLMQQEIIALRQAISVLKKFDIIAVAPIDLKVDGCIFAGVERFEADFFHSIDSYNRLMLSVSFYRRFQSYKYILIYQLDAFVFSDQLSYFCKLDYDYIGAPWLYGQFNYIDDSHCIWHVGNGGLSLRKVSSFIRILEDRKPLQKEQIINEDIFFSSIVDEKFRIAPIEVALQFSFERQVKTCYERNHYKLPFGCHAWERYDVAFWMPFIEQFGYTLQDACTNSGNEDERRKREYSFWEKASVFFEEGWDVEETRRKIKRILGREDRSCTIFGAGLYGNGISRWLIDMEIPVECFYDNNVELVEKTLNGYPIIHASVLQECKENNLIIISSYEYKNRISQQLIDMKYEQGKDFITLTELMELSK